MKKHLRKRFFVLAALLAAALVLLSAAAAAAPVSIQPESVEATACICDTSVTEFEVTNPSQQEDNYVFEVEDAEEEKTWGLAAPLSTQISGGQTAKVFAYLTPDCFALPGDYEFVFSAKSTTEQKTASIALKVTTCVSLENGGQKNLCAGETKEFRFILKNKSRTADKKYFLFLSGPAAQAATVPESVFVESGSSEEAALTIDSKKLGIGTHSLLVKAVSVYEATGQPTPDTATLDYVFVVEDCQQTTLEAEEQELEELREGCVGETKTLALTIRNNGAFDDYYTLSVNTSRFSLSEERVLVKARSTETVNATIELRKESFTARFVANSSLGSSAELLVPVSAINCFGAEITVSGPLTFCSEFGVNYSVTVKNTGKKNVFNLTASEFTVLSESQTILDENESKTFSLKILPNLSPTNYTLWIKAVSKNASAVKKFKIEVQDCFAVRLTGTNAHVCQCSDKAFSFNVVNIGTRDDVFIVERTEGPEWLKFKEPPELFIRSKAQKTLVPLVMSCDADPAVYKTFYTAISKEHANYDRLCINITVHSKNECYKADLGGKETRFVEEGVDSTFSFEIKNTGLEENTYSLAVEGSAAEWTRTEKEFVTLTKGETQEIFVSVSPPAGAAGKTFDLKLTALSRGVASSKEVSLRVVREGEAPTEEGALLPLPAEVSFANGSIEIHSLPGTQVTITSPSGKQETIETGADGFVVVPATETGVYEISFSREGHAPTKTSFEVSGARMLMAFDAATIALLVAAAIVAVALLYFLAKIAGRTSKPSKPGKKLRKK